MSYKYFPINLNNTLILSVNAKVLLAAKAPQHWAILITRLSENIYHVIALYSNLSLNYEYWYQGNVKH